MAKQAGAGRTGTFEGQCVVGCLVSGAQLHYLGEPLQRASVPRVERVGAVRASCGRATGGVDWSGAGREVAGLPHHENPNGEL